MKRIGILGSTGSIGRQALEVISEHKSKFRVEFLTAYNNYELLAEQAAKFLPSQVVIVNEAHYKLLKDRLKDLPIKVYSGVQAVNDIVQSEYDILLTALVGYSGLIPTIKAIETGHDIALANKETLVVAGDLIMKLAKEKKIRIVPVDSEHSAIFQCLIGEHYSNIEKIYLTASGGPFRGYSIEQLRNVSVEQALKHPNWSMGNKITIDSATMMNKGLEVIEARWLFDLEPSRIDVIVHPQSIIHSIVQFIDGSMKAQMGLPDMRLPILYAFSYPERYKSNFERFDFFNYPTLTFEKPDYKVFKALRLAFEALKKAGNYPCILNAANEVAVEAFLAGKIGFLDIANLIEEVLSNSQHLEGLDLQGYILCDKETRIKSYEILKAMRR